MPSAIGFLVLGDVIAAAMYRTGRFTTADATWVWAILAGSAVGMLASTLGRLYSSAYYACVIPGLRSGSPSSAYSHIGLGYLGAFPGPRWLGVDPAGDGGLTHPQGWRDG